MRPFEAEEYAEGWRVCVIGGERSENPYKPPYRGAWDRYRADAWDRGWFHCARSEPWNDPRKKRRT